MSAMQQSKQQTGQSIQQSNQPVNQPSSRVNYRESDENKKSVNMCYIIITGANLIWFIMSLIADMLVACAIVTPKWLISNYPVSPNETLTRRSAHFPSVGLYTRCKVMTERGFQCNTFDLDGFATDNKIYPPAWKAATFFMMLGFATLSLSVILTLLTCCRQAIFGKSLHNLTACFQVVSATCVMLAIFLHALAWGAERVQKLCGADAEPFFPGDCTIGISFYAAIVSVLLAFACAGISLKAESSNMRRKVKRRVEEGDRLVCVP